ncbi:MAG: polysaccharide deacetylase [Bryobacteraceae bacterium]|nr:polysaccharide deacetylase [Bryobacteraceae bacterium]
MPKRYLLSAIAALLLTCPAFPQQAPDVRQPGIRLSVDELRAQIRVSAGQRLRPTSWPNGARVAVALSFDVDNMSTSLLRGELGPGVLSRGAYGAVDGLPRILRLLDKHQVPASFFIPAINTLLHPQAVGDILASGRHEVGVHGWIHEDLPSLNNEAEEQRLLNQAIEQLTKATGKRPVGYRAPSWAFSPYTMGQVVKAGFLYDSSLMASDDAYEALLDGKPTGVIELPIEWILDDYPALHLPGAAMPSPELVNQVFQSEFDVAYEEGGLFILTMHPHVTGHRSRVAALEKLILHMKSRPGVWFATHEQVAQYVKEQSPLSKAVKAK